MRAIKTAEMDRDRIGSGGGRKKGTGFGIWSLDGGGGAHARGGKRPRSVIGQKIAAIILATHNAQQVTDEEPLGRAGGHSLPNKKAHMSEEGKINN
jgi:hypothetical protein